MKFRVVDGVGAIIAAAALLQACGYRNDKTNTDLQMALNAAPGTVLGYDSLKALIFQPKCISCHGNSGGVNLQSYSSTVAALSQIQSAVIDQQIMPPSGPLSAQEQGAIQAWINAGAPEQDISPTPTHSPTAIPSPSRTPSPTPSPSSSGGQVSYAQVNSQIFTPQCVSCHGNSGGVDLSTYSNVIQNLSKVQQQALTNKTMPPSGPLSASDQALLQSWISAGAPQ